MSKLEIDTDTLKQKRAKEIEEKMEERHFIIDTYRKKLTETEQFVDYMESLKRNHLHSIEVGENEDFALMIKSMSKTEFTGAHLESQLSELNLIAFHHAVLNTLTLSFQSISERCHRENTEQICE